MAHYRMDSEEEALFRSYPYAVYFVQSPTISHANSNTNGADQETDVRLALSRYSSSRGSNNSFHSNHKKKHSNDQVHLLLHKSDVKMNVVDHHGQEKINDDDHYGDDDDDDEDNDCHEKNGGWIKFFSFSYSNSGWWILLQLSWRFLVSLMIALLVFCVAANPPPPKFSVKVTGIPQFRLPEGVDASGVTTKILSCNFSIDVIIDNHSKLFALHLQPPIIQLNFGRLNFATSQSMLGRELYAGNDDSTSLRFHVGTKNKPMYGAGRNMQDYLESGKGMHLMIRVSLKSRFYVILGVFQPKYYHEAQCFVDLYNNYDKKRSTQVYNSTCIVH